MREPTPQGTVTLPSGEFAGVTFEPGKGYAKQTLVPGLSPETGRKQLDALIESLPADKQPEGKAIGDYWASRGDFDQAIKSVSSLVPRAEQRPFSVEEQALERLEAERKREGLGPMTSTELTKFHEKFQPFGAQKLQILLSNLGERKKQDLITDVDRLERQIKPYEHLQRISKDVDSYVDSPTGLGDVTLMNAYIEATRPDKGFRYVTTELNFIREARGLMEGAAARVAQGYSGTLFGPTGSDQRKIMADIVRKAAKQSAQLRQQTIKRYTNVRPELKDLLEEPEEGDTTEAPPSSPAPPAGFNKKVGPG